VYERRDIADIEESANAAPITLRAFIAIYLSAMHYTSLGVLVFSPSTLNPRSNAGIHPLLFAFLDRAASSENACREAAVFTVTVVIRGNSGETSVTLTRRIPSLVYPFTRMRA